MLGVNSAILGDLGWECLYGAKTVEATSNCPVLNVSYSNKSFHNMAPIYLNRILKPNSSIHSYNQKEIQNTTF